MAETTPTEAPTEAPETFAPPTPAPVTVGGRPYALKALGMREVGELTRWVNSTLPDPLKAIKPYLEGEAPATQRVMIDQALADLRRPVVFASPEFNGAMQTSEGLREVLWLSLKRGGFAGTRAQSDAAADAMDLDGAGDVYAAALLQ